MNELVKRLEARARHYDGWDGDPEHAALLREAAAALTEGEMVRGWQPIETAPKDGTEVLLGHATSVFSGCWDAFAEGWVTGVTDRYEELIVYHPTHWMPLPKSPAFTEEGGE